MEFRDSAAGGLFKSILNFPILLDFVLLFSLLESACPGQALRSSHGDPDEPKPFSAIPSPLPGVGLDVGMR